MKKEQIVSRNPKVMNGTLVFTGTRVPVESLIQRLTAGDSLNEFLDDFPTVSREQVVAYLKMTLEVVNVRAAEFASRNYNDISAIHIALRWSAGLDPSVFHRHIAPLERKV